MEETLEGGQGPPRAVAPFERENCTALYEGHFGKFIQQLKKVKGFEYLQHIN
jgi:hypothetical protein